MIPKFPYFIFMSLSLFLAVGDLLLVGILFPQLPAEVPSAFNDAGEVVEWRNRGSLFIEPAVALLLVVVFTLMQVFPAVRRFMERTQVHSHKYRLNMPPRYEGVVMGVALLVCVSIIVLSTIVAIWPRYWHGIDIVRYVILGLMLIVVIPIVAANRHNIKKRIGSIK